MPSHPDRVRKNMCPEHDWHLIPGVRRIDTFHFVLDGYECWNCGTIISKNEYDKLIGPVWDRSTADLNNLKQNIKDLLK